MSHAELQLAAAVKKLAMHDRWSDGCKGAAEHRIAAKALRREIQDVHLPLVRAGKQQQGRLDNLYQ